MSISPKSGARGIQKLLHLKYYLLRWESRCILELNAAVNMELYEKILQIKIVPN